MIKNRNILLGKKGLSLMLSLILFLGVLSAGCSGGQAADKNNNSLTISVLTKDMYLDTAVKRFQELYPNVSVEVKEYTSNPLPPASGNSVIMRAEDPGDIEKYVTAMNTQLMSGQGSDIIMLNNLPYETYADKNLLADLNQMMQSDQEFDGSKYYQNIIEALKYKGNLYGLPISFSVDMMAADRTILDSSQVKIDDRAWSWSDFVNTAEKVINDNKKESQSMYALAGMDEKRLIASLVKENYSKLVDTEKKKADFTGEEFLDLLNLSKYLLDNKLVYTDTAQANMADLASRGMLIFNITPIRGFMDLQAAQKSLSGEVQLLKLPGSGENLFFSTNSMYGISSKSANKELAWEFLKLLVSDEMMIQRTLAGMPLNKSVVPQIAEEMANAMQKGGSLVIKSAGSIQAQPITLQPPTQEDIDFALELFSKANCHNKTDQKIISIVQEEATAFFTGQKTAETTAKLIQERVSTYLNE